MPLTACSHAGVRTQIAAASNRGNRAIGTRRCRYYGCRLAVRASNGEKWRMGQWLENRAEVEVDAPVERCWTLWEDRERIPQWMPWIASVQVLPEDRRLSRWILRTEQFGRQWELSWLARNLAPVQLQKLHWVSEPGSAQGLGGVQVNNRGQIRLVRRGPQRCAVSLTISYEVPDVLLPFANALNPLVQGILQRDMERFKVIAVQQTDVAA